MLKKYVVSLVLGIALTIAVAGASGVVADSLGLSMTPQAHACGSGNGGGC